MSRETGRAGRRAVPGWAAGQLERIVARLVVEDLGDDHDAFLGDDFLRAELAFLAVVLRVLLLAALRVAALREWAVLRCSAMINSMSLQPKNGRRRNRFRWAMRELLRPQGVGECGLI